MINRLLSEQEMKDQLPTGFDPEPCDREMCKAQLAKTDKEWVEWLDSKCPHDSLGINNFTKRECFECWQERKKEIGL